MRPKPSVQAKAIVAWSEDLRAYDALVQAVGEEYAGIVEYDLSSHDNVIMVSWYSKETDDHSDMSEFGSLDWNVPDNSQVIISYDDTATPEQIDEFERWMVETEQQDGL
jgi:hypothetical protein